MAVYKANEELLKGYRWTSILDTGVCARCGALDGTFYKKDEQRPVMPLHPRCRCLWLPVLKGDKLEGDGLEEAARPWLRRELKNIDEGGKRKILYAGTTKEDFSGWWETLSQKEQDFSVGPVRAKLLKEGKLKFSELVDKSTGRLKTLEELGYTEGGKPLVMATGSASGNKPAITIKPVANRQELADQLKVELSKHTKNGPITDVIFVNNKNYLMATNCKGKLYISEDMCMVPIPNRPGAYIPYTPADDLQSGWTSIAKGDPLTFSEECAFKTLCHETQHNRMVVTGNLGKKATTLMETVNEWVARRSYSEFVISLGGKTKYEQIIISNAPSGYQDMVMNFSALMNALGIPDDATTLAHFRNMIETVDWTKYKKASSDYFVKVGNGNLKKKDINVLLSNINYNQNNFLNLLQIFLQMP